MWCVNMAPTPKMEAVSSRNCAMRYSTESCICPGGGTVKPAMPKPMAARNDVTATAVWILVIVFMSKKLKLFEPNED